MGSGFSFECGACGYVGGFRLGVGFLSASFENALDLLKPEDRLQVRAAIESHDDVYESHGYAIYSCPHCNWLENEFSMAIVQKKSGAVLYKNYVQCGKCGQDMQVISQQDLYLRPCPSCGERALREGSGDSLLVGKINWD